jgi:hypothetical protein
MAYRVQAHRIVQTRAILETTMQKPHPEPYDIVRISLPRLMSVACEAMLRDKADWEIIEEAIDDWLRKNAPGQCGEPEFAGYQWKGLFLPHGTVLRAAFQGKNHHAHVENDLIMFQGKAMSPSAFVSAVGGIRRNAWKSIWLLLPDTKHWQLADAMRARGRPPTARKTARRTRAHLAPPPSIRQAAPEPVITAPAVVPRARSVPPAIAGWARLRRQRRPFAGRTNTLVDLLRRELQAALSGQESHAAERRSLPGRR